ncbi:response regulator [Fredinandcohnia sp. QZ13]|uniref:response regulator n=1 Tax=Fredinandcohnia sp. QZ13 TaxID=3073144 RepID=UPI002853451C|nr:response regulator [Fredinandcohnia sp. QZ13]MDR4888109.1 response regulator [Fredinandcohnia sp. QZ13]
MCTAMIIDDDVPMLKYLETILNWEELGIEIVASTFSSLKALSLFEELQPDLVITDIGLPQIDGLELAVRFKEKNPDIRVILLTCHEDFYYAKKAIQINVDDYLIKDELTKEQLEESVLKSLEILKESNEFQEALYYQDTIEHNKELLKKSFLKKLADSELDENILSFSRSLGINWRHHDFIVCRLVIDYTSCKNEVLLANLSFLQNQLLSIMERATQDKEEYTILQDENENIFLIYNFKNRLTHNSYKDFQCLLLAIHNEVKQHLSLNVQFFYDRICKVKELGSSVNKLYYRKPISFYEKITHVYIEVPSKGISYNLPKETLLVPFAKDLMNAVQYGNIEDVSKAIQYLEKISQTLILDPVKLKRKCISIVNLVCKNDRAFEQFEVYVENAMTLKQMLHILQLKIQNYMESLQKSRFKQNQGNPKLKEIDQYIIENLSENITSVIMANHLHLNPSYFSRYFKQLTGENFTDYVHRFKMRIATSMLTERFETIEFITYSLGYSDRTYFSKIFKKYTGMSPGEYKRTQKQPLHLGNV